MQVFSTLSSSTTTQWECTQIKVLGLRSPDLYMVVLDYTIGWGIFILFEMIMLLVELAIVSHLLSAAKRETPDTINDYKVLCSA